jgi:NodT family efflux transporter outer membrane factor (OMF) lipoprotein
MNKTLGASLLALSATLAGCNFAPDYKVPETPTTPQFKEAGPWKAGAPADDLTRGDWWTLYNDARLNELEAQIDPASPDLAAAVARYDQARMLAVEAGAPLLPRLDGEGSTSQNRQSARRPLRSANQPNQYANNVLGAQASYELDFWGKYRNIAQAATNRAQASGADLETARLGLHAELAADYLTLRGLDAEGQLLQDTVDSYAKALKLTQDRFAGKISSGIDVSRAQTQLETANAAVADIRGRRAVVEHAIATLVGKSASQFSLAPEVITIALPRIPTGLPSTLLQRRPDIAAAERLVAASNADIGIAKAAFYPQVTLTALGGFENTGGVGALVAAPYSFWSVGPSVDLPIFTNGLLEAREQRAYAANREASENYRGTVLKAFQEVEDQLALLRELAGEAVSEEAAVKAAEHTLDLSLHLYRDGASSYLDVTVAQTAALQVELRSLELTTRQQQASVTLIRALGGGWSTADLPNDEQITEMPDLAATP